jgi:hypothetical protein
MATPLKFFASIGQWAQTLEGFDLKLHPKQTRFWVWLSWALPLGFVGAVWPALIGAGGVGGLVTYWLGPWLVFHCWMSVTSLVQHTGPHITWAEEVRQLPSYFRLLGRLGNSCLDRCSVRTWGVGVSLCKKADLVSKNNMLHLDLFNLLRQVVEFSRDVALQQPNRR